MRIQLKGEARVLMIEKSDADNTTQSDTDTLSDHKRNSDGDDTTKE